DAASTFTCGKARRLTGIFIHKLQQKERGNEKNSSNDLVAIPDVGNRLCGHTEGRRPATGANRENQETCKKTRKVCDRHPHRTGGSVAAVNGSPTTTDQT